MIPVKHQLDFMICQYIGLKVTSQGVNTRDIDIEKIESNEKSLDDGITKEQDINKNQNTSSTIFKNMTGISKIMVEVPEDIMITNDAFKEIVNKSKNYDIINDLLPR